MTANVFSRKLSRPMLACACAILLCGISGFSKGEVPARTHPAGNAASDASFSTTNDAFIRAFLTTHRAKNVPLPRSLEFRFPAIWLFSTSGKALAKVDAPNGLHTLDESLATPVRESPTASKAADWSVFKAILEESIGAKKTAGKLPESGGFILLFATLDDKSGVHGDDAFESEIRKLQSKHGNRLNIVRLHIKGK